MARLLLVAAVLVGLLWPRPGQAVLTEASAKHLLIRWIESGQSPRFRHCHRAVEARFVNGGYTITVDNSACPSSPPHRKRWRINAYSTEVFEENEKGKFVFPMAATGGGPLANVAGLTGHADLLPPDARIIEFAALGPDIPDRAYLLWMLHPSRQPHAPGEIYTCPDRSRGSYWSGPTRLSLLDTANMTLRNTLAIKDPLGEDDVFDLPYQLPGTDGYPYFVPQGFGPERVGQPELLRLRDLDGDGAAREFSLASAGNCMLLLLAAFGYDPDSDTVRSLPVTLTVRKDRGATETTTDTWLNFWPLTTGGRDGRYQWEVDTRGRAGCLERYAVAYDRTHRRFSGTLDVSDCQP